MSRADWLNLAQAMLVGLQYFNVQLVNVVHVSPVLTAAAGAMLASGTMFVHLLGVNTPVPVPPAAAAPTPAK
jgi:hypothetical protein